MATITSGSNATGTFGTADSITVTTRGNARFECPTGTTVAEFSGTRTFGPYTSATFRVTAVSGSADYEVLDGSGPRAEVLADIGTGALYANGSPVSGDDVVLTGMDRIWPINNSNSGNSVPGNRTTHIKRAAEAPFSRARLWLMRRSDSSSSVTVGAFRALCAVTETAADTDANTRYRPIIGGVVQNVAFDASNVAGWRTVTWSGANNVSIAGTTDVGAPIFVASDWIDLRAIPRADGGTRPLALARVYYDAASGGSSVFSDFSSWNTGAAGSDYGREYFVENYGGDSLTTLANNPAGTQNGTGLGLCVFFEFDYDVPVRTYYGAGDSLIASPNIGTNARFDSWLLRAVNGTSTPAAPRLYVNGGIASRCTHEYVNALIQHITLGGRPTDVVILVGSGNDDPAKGSAALAYTPAQNASVQALVMKAMAACREIGARVYLVTISPRTWDATKDSYRVALNAWTRSICATGAATLIDMDAVVTDGATPARLAAACNGGDSIHFSAAGSAALDAYARTVI